MEDKTKGYFDLSDEELQKEAEELMREEGAKSIEREKPEDPLEGPPPEMPPEIKANHQKLGEQEAKGEFEKGKPQVKPPIKKQFTFGLGPGELNQEGAEKMVKILGKALGKNSENQEE